MNSRHEKELRRMSCADLRKCAKKHGIKANMKAEKIIEELLRKIDDKDDSFVLLEKAIENSYKKNIEHIFEEDKRKVSLTPRRETFTVEDEDSFLILERKIVNSQKKNKEKLFDEDKKIASDTPRRETYSLDNPSEDIKIINASLIGNSASPDLKKLPENEISATQASGKKKRMSKRKVSFVTPLRRSARISAVTPIYNSVKNRPKTPMPSKVSFASKGPTENQKNISVVESLNLDSSVEMDSKRKSSVKRPSTPMPNSNRRGKILSGKKEVLTEDDSVTPHKSITDTVLNVLKEEDDDVKEPVSSSKKINLVKLLASNSAKKHKQTPPGFKKLATPISMVRRCSPRSLLKSAARIGFTPNTLRNISTPKSDFNKSTPLIRFTPTPNKIINTPKSGFNKSTTLTRFTPITNRVINTPKSGFNKSTTLTRFTPTTNKIINTPRVNNKSLISSSSKMTAKKTPNFQKIHQKAFDKMESIDDYQKRKENNSKSLLGLQKVSNTSIPKAKNMKKLSAENAVKSKIPKTYGGIPFVPVAAATRPMRINVAKSAHFNQKSGNSPTPLSLNQRILAKKKATRGNARAMKNIARENSTIKKRPKFDLNASLSRKLPYKPHTGPLKPLGETNLNTTSNGLSVEKVNEVAKANRLQSREILRGVRKNRRFNLQMNNRMMNVSSKQ